MIEIVKPIRKAEMMLPLKHRVRAHAWMDEQGMIYTDALELLDISRQSWADRKITDEQFQKEINKYSQTLCDKYQEYVEINGLDIFSLRKEAADEYSRNTELNQMEER